MVNNKCINKFSHLDFIYLYHNKKIDEFRFHFKHERIDDPVNLEYYSINTYSNIPYAIAFIDYIIMTDFKTSYRKTFKKIY